MEKKETFKMTYSAQQQNEIQEIRGKYTPREPDKLELLRSLDAHVEKRASIRSISIGTIGALLLGTGMSLIMTELGASLGAAALPAGCGVGLVGIIILALAYPIYRRSLKAERSKVAPEIIRLADELMQ